MFKIVTALFLLALAALGAAGLVTPGIDARLNPVVAGDAAEASARARALHDSLAVADLHSDMLLWDRNHRARQGRGQTDLARLREGGVALQVFSTVTASPKGQNFDANDIASGDRITTLALAQGWPLATLGSLRARAVLQAERLVALERAGELTILRSAADMDAPGLRGLLLTEGAHPLEGELANIDHLYAAGYRAMGLTHFFDNALGGSMHGRSQGGLTEFGQAAVDRMAERGILIDLAHASPAMARDVLDRVKGPVFVSHTGIAGACPGTENRNLSDATLQRIAGGGGIVGIAFFEGAICDISAGGVADTIVAAVALLGEHAVALGSDFDGTVATSFDASELVRLTDALLARGVSERVIRKVMGENVERFLRDTLPDERIP